MTVQVSISFLLLAAFAATTLAFLTVVDRGKFAVSDPSTVVSLTPLTLPTASPRPIVTREGTAGDLDCGDFASQGAAQVVFEALGRVKPVRRDGGNRERHP